MDRMKLFRDGHLIRLIVSIERIPLDGSLTPATVATAKMYVDATYHGRQ